MRGSLRRGEINVKARWRRLTPSGLVKKTSSKGFAKKGLEAETAGKMLDGRGGDHQRVRHEKRKCIQNEVTSSQLDPESSGEDGACQGEDRRAPRLPS